jgi:DNA-binding transcriptional LysR family regulator
LQDVLVFLSVYANGSVVGAARQHGTTPSHVSKSLQRLEQQLQTRLLARGGRGVKLTPAAVKLMPLLVTAADALRRARRGADLTRDVTVAAPSYLLSAFVPALVERIEGMRFRSVQLSPPTLLAAMGLRQFDVALSTGDAKLLPPSWRAETIGELDAGLFASPQLARSLGKVTPDALRKVPFVIPISFNNGQWEPVNDACPIPASERIVGHEAPAVGLALAIASRTNQLVFGPRLAARELVKQRKLVELRVPGWNVHAPLFLAVDIDRVTSRELGLIKAVAQSLLV